MAKQKNIFTAVLLLLFACCHIAAVEKDDRFSDVSVDVEFVNSAYASYHDAGSIPRRKVVPVNKWLRIEISYNTPAGRDVLPQVRFSGNKPIFTSRGWLDNVELEVRAVFNTGLMFRNKPVYGMFTGKTVFWTVRLDGDTHQTYMFVPAMLIDRYCIGKRMTVTVGRGGVVTTGGKPAPGTKSVTRAGVKDFTIEAVFRCRGIEIGRGYYNVSGSRRQRANKFNDLLNKVAPDMTLEGAILPRFQSPWAVHEPNFYDAEKPLLPSKK